MWRLRALTAFSPWRGTIRSLRRRGAFAVTFVLVLALAFGGHATVVRLLNGALRKAPPGVPELRRLFWISSTDSLGRLNLLSLRDYDELHHELFGLANVASYTSAAPTMAQRARSQPVRAQIVTSNYFDALNVSIRRGRGFVPDEDTPGPNRLVAVVSERLWRSYFGADPRLVGKAVRLNGHFFTIVGIAPAGFHGLEVVNPADLWMPPSTRGHILPAHENAFNQRVFGRLHAGASRADLERSVEIVAERIVRSKWKRGWFLGMAVSTPRGGVHPADYAYTASQAVPALAISMFLLVLVTANVVLLVLTRVISLRHEWAIRLALGASVLRVSTPLVKELMLVFALGMAGALAVSAQVAPLALASQTYDLPINLGLDAVVIGEVVGMGMASMFCALLAGLHRASKISILSVLKEGDAGTTAAPRSTRLQTGLVVCQFALTVVLVATSFTTTSNLYRASRSNEGVSQPERILAIQFDRNQVAPSRVNAALSSIEGLPGVTASALAAMIPLSGDRMRTSIQIPGGGTNHVNVRMNVVSPGYFDLVQTQMLRGRSFTSRDDMTAPGVVVVDDALTNGQSTRDEYVGQHIRVGAEAGSLVRVVGVVRATASAYPEDAELPSVYLSHAQDPDHPMTLLARVSESPAQMKIRISRRLESLGLPPSTVTIRSLVDHARERTAGARTATWLALLAAILGLILSATALYGAVEYDVTNRRVEIGIRRALGATPGAIIRLAISKPLRIAVLGGMLGFLSLFMIGIISPALFGGGTLLLAAMPVVLVLSLAGVFAVALPTYQAVSVSPADALR